MLRRVGDPEVSVTVDRDRLRGERLRVDHVRVVPVVGERGLADDAVGEAVARLERPIVLQNAEVEGVGHPDVALRVHLDVDGVEQRAGVRVLLVVPVRREAGLADDEVGDRVGRERSVVLEDAVVAGVGDPQVSGRAHREPVRARQGRGRRVGVVGVVRVEAGLTDDEVRHQVGRERRDVAEHPVVRGVRNIEVPGRIERGAPRLGEAARADAAGVRRVGPAVRLARDAVDEPVADGRRGRELAANQAECEGEGESTMHAGRTHKVSFCGQIGPAPARVQATIGCAPRPCKSAPVSRGDPTRRRASPASGGLPILGAPIPYFSGLTANDPIATAIGSESHVVSVGADRGSDRVVLYPTASRTAARTSSSERFASFPSVTRGRPATQLWRTAVCATIE